jgi:SpoVK/Ycf46/Vps4 family AAA+-type ATPase
MDEIDSIGSSRIESGSGGDSEVQRTMLELLNQLDGFEATKNIKVCHGFKLGPNTIFMLTECVRTLRIPAQKKIM